MAESEVFSTAPVGEQYEQRGRWPLSAWIIPDLLLVFVLTLVLSLGVIAISLGLRVNSGELVFDGSGGFRFSNGTPLELATDLLTPGVFFASIIVQNVSFAIIVALRVIVLRRLPWSWLGVRLQVERPLQLLVNGVGLGVVFLLLNFASSYIFERLGIRQNQAAQFPIRQNDFVGQLLVFFAATVVAPLGEELLFRGYIYHALQQDLGKWVAYGVSAALFSAVHIFGVTEGVVALLIPLFLGGLLLAWGVDRTKSLVPSIIAHAMNNGVAMSALLYCTNNPSVCQPS